MEDDSAIVDYRTVDVTASRNGLLKTVFDGTDYENAPRDFREIVQAIDDVVSQVTDWKKIE